MTATLHDAILQDVSQHWRAGRRTEARTKLSVALSRGPDDATLLGFAGLLACQDDDPRSGADLLRRALAIDPQDQANRTNLLTALVALDAIDEAAIEGEHADAANPRVARLLGYVAQRQERHADAGRFYSTVVKASPGDAQSWNNLGNARASIGDVSGAMDAFERAIRLTPNDPAPRVNASKALAGADRHRERLAWMRRATAAIPTDREVQVEAGLAEAAERHFTQAEASFRSAIALQPDHAEAYIELGLLLENLNRIDDLGELVSSARDHGIDPDEIALLAAWLARRRGEWQVAGDHASRIRDDILPLRRHHLLADIADRSGDPTTAFAEFTAMNEAALALTRPAAGPSYRDLVVEQTAMLARQGRAAIGPVATGRSPQSPTFIIGFPRSGTTLLDTLLMNDPRFHVMEELPMLPLVEDQAGREGNPLSADPERLRQRYFELVDDLAPVPVLPKGVAPMIVDKFPLHLARIPLLHRMFPDAKVVLVERHPCDVVLSCFMANFQLNHAMRHFTSLKNAAELYDTVFSSFEQAATLLPIDIHRVRYEQMVADLEGEMRPLMTFLGKSWSPAVLDNQASAARRDHIRTASYSQVTEPIYRRAAGRWERYRPFMQEVLPILAPWCERLGYALD